MKELLWEGISSGSSAKHEDKGRMGCMKAAKILKFPMMAPA